MPSPSGEADAPGDAAAAAAAADDDAADAAAEDEDEAPIDEPPSAARLTIENEACAEPPLAQVLNAILRLPNACLETGVLGTGGSCGGILIIISCCCCGGGTGTSADCAMEPPLSAACASAATISAALSVAAHGAFVTRAVAACVHVGQLYLRKAASVQR
jgi:hypothetical protein